ncbi:MFS transporter [Kribbella sp. HUAS MG21]|uniref:MFS transporter n=1 Tax=Kribbella sp. HUAS MG21 TaxID=3160966 RepID=A0AAU7T655_9ACTN
MKQSLSAHRDFRLFWTGETVSLLGAQVSTLALPLTAIEVLGADDGEVGVLRFVQLAPYLFLALVFGVWVDRVSRRRVMIGANLVRLISVAALPVLYAFGLLTLPALLVLAAVIGLASVMFDVSWMSFVPSIVRDPARYPEATAKLSATSSATDVVGPGAAGLLVSAVGAPIALAVDAVSYLVSVLTLSRIRVPERHASTERRRAVEELREGLRWVFGNPILRALALIGFCCNLSMVSTWTMFLIYGSTDLGLPPAVLGAVFSAASVGGLVGALLSGWVTRRFRVGKVYLVAQSAVLLGPLIIPVAEGSRVVIVAAVTLSFLVTYLGLGVANVVIVSTRQGLTSQRMMGRMTSVFRTLLFGGGALGGLLGGLLSAALGSRSALLVVALVSAAIVPVMARTPIVRLATYPRLGEAVRSPAS